jgi:2-C-methyl-D-erythritol 4-phosphate cytidylyltransferase
VIIHDGARPFVSAALIDRCVESAAEKGAVVVGLPARDTIKVVGDDRLIRSTPERRSLWEIQTPQVFQKELIVAAHQQAERDGVEVTDDAMVVERFGMPVYVLEGERTNLKITLPEDIWLAEMMIREGRVP